MEDKIGSKTLGKLLKEHREQVHAKVAELAPILGISTKTIYRWEKGQGEPRMSEAAKLERLLNMEAGTIFSKVLEILGIPEECRLIKSIPGDIVSDVGGASDLANLTDPPGGYITVPLISPHTPVCCGTGNGYEGVELVIESHILVASESVPNSNSDMLRAMKAIGDSMSPKINDGDTVVFELGADPTPGWAAVISYKGQWMVRGIMPFHGKEVILRAMNQAYRDIHVEWGDQDLEVKGKVVARIPSADNPGSIW